MSLHDLCTAFSMPPRTQRKRWKRWKRRQKRRWRACHLICRLSPHRPSIRRPRANPKQDRAVAPMQEETVVRKTKDGLQTGRLNVVRAGSDQARAQVPDMARGACSCTVWDVSVDASLRQGMLLEVAQAVRHPVLALVLFCKGMMLLLGVRLHPLLRVL